MSERIFEKYFNADKEDVLAAKKDLVEKKVKRGFSSAIDSLAERKIDIEMRIEKLRYAVANGDTGSIQALAALQVDINETDRLLKIMQNEEDAFFLID